MNSASSGSSFLFVGGHPAIDFVNTLAQAPGPGTEWLLSWGDVIDWLKEAGLSDGKRLGLEREDEGAALDAVRGLRQAWKRVVAGVIAGKPVPAKFLEEVNAVLKPDVFSEVLVQERKGVFCLTRTPSRVEGGALGLAILARAIAEFLATAEFEYLRQCANHESCVLSFYDTTKNHRRQWCSNAMCGNRHKVAEFRRRRRGG